MVKAFGRFLRRNTIALLALFLALGGTTYAASTALIGRNTVSSPQVVNGSLQTKDLSAKARKALKGNRGLRGLTGARGATGAQGAKGATGAQGVKGDSGPAIAWGYINSDGSVSKASSNVTSTWDPGPPSRYEITISGEDYFFSSYVTLVTPTGSTALIPATSSVGGKLLVLFKDTGGGAQQAPSGFQFVTFKP